MYKSLLFFVTLLLSFSGAYANEKYAYNNTAAHITFDDIVFDFSSTSEIDKRSYKPRKTRRVPGLPMPRISRGRSRGR